MLGIYALFQPTVVAGAVMNVLLVCTASIALALAFGSEKALVRTFCGAYSGTTILLLLFCCNKSILLSLESVYQVCIGRFEMPENPFGDIYADWSAAIVARLAIPILAVGSGFLACAINLHGRR